MKKSPLNKAHPLVRLLMDDINGDSCLAEDDAVSVEEQEEFTEQEGRFLHELSPASLVDLMQTHGLTLSRMKRIMAAIWAKQAPPKVRLELVETGVASPASQPSADSRTSELVVLDRELREELRRRDLEDLID